MSRAFTGATSMHLDTPSSAVYNQLAAFTYALWFYSSDATKSSQLFLKDPDNTQINNLTVSPGSAGNQVIQALAFGKAAGGSARSSTQFAVNQFHHIGVTFDSTAGSKEPRLYLDGIEVSYSSQSAFSGSLANDTTQGLRFGFSTFDDGSTPCFGNQAENVVYNRALTPTEMLALASSTTGASGIAAANLVGYWHLCGTMSPEPDSSGNGNSAIVSSNPPMQGPNSPGFGCSVSMPYSVPDCRNYATFPNASRNVQETLIYDVPSVDSRAAGAPVDSRAAGAPVDSRIAPNIPENSRAPGIFGPGE